MISTNVLDSVRGVPAVRIPVQLDVFITGQGWIEVGHGVTASDGSIDDFGEDAVGGIYRLMFDIAAYWPDAYFPSITVTFEVREPGHAHHFPVILSPFGYSLYRAGVAGFADPS